MLNEMPSSEANEKFSNRAAINWVFSLLSCGSGMCASEKEAAISIGNNGANADGQNQLSHSLDSPVPSLFRKTFFTLIHSLIPFEYI